MATVKVAVTGAAGQIGYSLLFRLASGEVFGPNTQVRLSLVELPVALKGAEGTAMEIEDCGFKTLEGIDINDNPEAGFNGVNWALLVGSKPRGPGMERNDLLLENGPIFTRQGKALSKAAKDIRIVTVGNPCNTNCLIAQASCPDVPANRFTAMTMLDQNRAKAQLALKAGVGVGSVTNLVIWGNHSSTMFPDFENAKINGKPVPEVITDRKWLESDFMTTVQKRGAAIITARGKSSAASAASACIDHMWNWMRKTESGNYFSAAIPSDGNPYGIPEGIIFSFPMRSDGNGNMEVVKDFSLTAYAKGKIAVTQKELEEEKAVIKDLLGK